MIRRRPSYTDTPAFHPTDFPSIIAYSETPIIGESSGDVVENWQDASGHSHPIVSSLESGGSYEVNEINGQPVVKFVSGKLAFIYDHADLDVNHFTILGALRMDAYYVGGSVICMKAHPTSWNNGYGLAEYGGLLYAFANAYDIGAVTYTRPSAGTPFAFAVRYNGITIELWLHGVQVASLPYTAATPTNTHELQFGGAVYISQASWAAFGLCNDGLDDTQLGQWFGYTNDTFGV